MDQEPANALSPAVVRTLTANDHARLALIDQRLTGRSRGEWYRQRLRRALAESDVNVSLGAEVDGALVGAVLASIQFGEYGRPERLAVIDTILVHSAFQRQGVAAALLEQLIKNLRALGVDRVRTEVAWTESSLLGFLAGAGFIPVPRLVLEHGLGES